MALQEFLVGNRSSLELSQVQVLFEILVRIPWLAENVAAAQGPAFRIRKNKFGTIKG